MVVQGLLFQSHDSVCSHYELLQILMGTKHRTKEQKMRYFLY